MRRPVITATAVLLLAVATACSGSSTDAKPAAVKSTPAGPTPDQQFLAAVDEAAFTSWANAAPTDEELLAYPPMWCGELEAGHSVAYILGDDASYPIGDSWGTAKTDAQQLVVLAVTSHCPKLRDAVTAELRDTGAF